VACLGQATWQTVTNPPGVDFKGLTGAKRQSALRVMQTEECRCGCGMKIAECRVKDPTCAVSLKASMTIVKDLGEGKTVAQVHEHLNDVLDDPVTISTAGDPVLGPDKARITIVEFSDFQCPYCSEVVPKVKAVLRQFPSDVRLVFKQFPLDEHSEAEFGAEAALAAQAQGKFWEMHDLLYAGFPDISRDRVMGYAKQIKLDMNRFTSELDSHKYKARVLSEEKEGTDAGVGGTPTFFFNGRKYNGSFDLAAVTPIIKKELK
jgi:protein-disulfide isomerase